MASITIRKLDEETKRKLRIRAAQNGRSMEEEARMILNEAVDTNEISGKDFARRIHQRFAEIGGVNLAEPERNDYPEPIDFDTDDRS